MMGKRWLGGKSNLIWATVQTAALAIAVAATPGLAGAQAAASYGILAGKSAATTAKTATSVNRATNKLAGRIADSVSKSTSKSPQFVMEENRQKLATKSKEGGAILHIQSVPDKATVLIDGEPVAKTPADLMVPEGKHVVELKQPASLDWREEISVTRDEDVSLKPELKKRYESAITVSFE